EKTPAARSLVRAFPLSFTGRPHERPHRAGGPPVGGVPLLPGAVGSVAPGPGPCGQGRSVRGRAADTLQEPGGVRHAGAHAHLGLALKAQGKADEAIACYRKAIAIDPRSASVHYNLGASLYGKGKVDEAIACYRKAIALDPRHAEAHCNLGNALRRQGRLTESL